ncbi:MAG: restriction endonuclease [Candidatus Coatesbacteria bacterium]|nr:restriction endonuclease [Candidatus Coatesbacteria bacterium]
MEHEFTSKIIEILKGHFRSDAAELFEKSQLLQYINLKTVSATRGSKARSSFANLYAIYVLIEDYLAHGYHKKQGYAKYDGARFSSLFRRQRELPFGEKLQNHALNHRMNLEFRKYFPQAEVQPILRTHNPQRYWINEKLLILGVGRRKYNLAPAIMEIIDAYIAAKQEAFANFIQVCQKMREISKADQGEVEEFISDLIAPSVDARIFEIVSYAILKLFYFDQVLYFGFEQDELEQSPLKLYKTGRTNANDGGIDFVMRPLGRFFQVTETLDVRKYFLDIDKIERYPISFVIKSTEDVSVLIDKLREGAEKHYAISAIVETYMSCIEEIINIPILKERFTLSVARGYLSQIMDEITRQSMVEFNIDGTDDDEQIESLHAGSD